MYNLIPLQLNCLFSVFYSFKYVKFYSLFYASTDVFVLALTHFNL